MKLLLNVKTLSKLNANTACLKQFAKSFVYFKELCRQIVLVPFYNLVVFTNIYSYDFGLVIK